MFSQLQWAHVRLGLDSQMEVTDTLFDNGTSYCDNSLCFRVLMMSIVFLVIQVHCICLQDNANEEKRK